MINSNNYRQAPSNGRRIQRELLREIEHAFEEKYCVVLSGPYEVGKSVLAQAVASWENSIVLDASDSATQTVLKDGNGPLFNSAGRLLVIDEVDALPDVFDLIRHLIEVAENSKAPIGNFFLVGSQPDAVRRLTAVKLGARARVLELAPITLSEIIDDCRIDAGEARILTSPLTGTEPVPLTNSSDPLRTLWMRGGFPESLIASDDAVSSAWRRDYIAALCNRGYHRIDPRLSATSVHGLLQRLCRLHGTIFVKDRFEPHEQAFINHLEDVGLLRKLRPWSTNSLKILEKHPRLFMRDSGLVHCLLAKLSHEALRADADAFGSSWEGFCVEQLVVAAKGASAFYYRAKNKDKDEIDLVLEFPRRPRLAIEIKANKTCVRPGFHNARRDLGEHSAFLVTDVKESFDRLDYRVMKLPDMIQVVRAASNAQEPFRSK